MSLPHIVRTNDEKFFMSDGCHIAYECLHQYISVPISTLEMLSVCATVTEFAPVLYTLWKYHKKQPNNKSNIA